MIPLAFSRIFSLNRGNNAAVQVVVQNQRTYLGKGSLHGLDLLDHVNAVGIFIYHSFDTLDMTGRTGQSLSHRFSCCIIHISPLLPTPLGGGAYKIISGVELLSSAPYLHCYSSAIVSPSK